MHRSGTSALTRLLSIAGAKLPEHLMGEGVGNETGHWESARLVACDDRILESLNSSWDDWLPLDLHMQSWAWRQTAKDEITSIVRAEYSGAKLIVVKDPRICRFADLFIEAVENAEYEARCLLMLRSPIEVAHSLEARNGMSRGAAMLLWLRHTLDAEAATRGRARSIVPYEELLSDWRRTLGRVTDDLTLHWPHALDDIKERAEAFLQSERRHHRSTPEQLLLDPMMRRWAAEVYEALLVLARNPNAATALAALDDARRQFDAASPVIKQLLAEADTKHAAHIECFVREVGEARAAHEAIGTRLSQAVDREVEGAARLAEAERLTQELRGQADAMALERAKAEAANETLASTNSALRARIENQEKRQAQAEESRARAEGLLRAQEAKIRHWEAALADANEARAAREIEIGDAMRTLHAVIAKKDEEIERLDNAVSAYERQLNDYRAEAATYGARVGRLLTRARRRLAPTSSVQARALGGIMRLTERTYRRIRGGAPVTIGVGPAAASDIPALAPHTGGRTAPSDYAEWIRASEPTPSLLDTQRNDVALAASGPLISIIVPVYKVPAAVLQATVSSVRQQTYSKWELCIAYADLENDANWTQLQEAAAQDSRIRPIRLDANKGISGNSNAALAIARGEFIGLLDHDDELTPWALYDMARAIETSPQADFFYSDKDCIDEHGTQRFNPLFKPAWSPEMMFSVNYLTHFNVMRRAIVEQIGGWRSETDGAQDWDIFLRVIEKGREVVRVPGVHYHWRLLPTSTATGIAAKPYAVSAQLRTIRDRVARLGLRAHVTEDNESGFRLHWAPPTRPCADIVIVDPAKRDLTKWLAPDAALFSAWAASLTIVAPDEQHASIGALNARTVTYATEQERTGAILSASSAGGAPVIAFIDGRLDALSDAWLMDLAGWVMGVDDLGFAGGLLLTPSNEVIEAGRVVGASGTSAPLFLRSPLHQWGWFGGPLWFRNVSAVGPHLATVRRSAWDADQRDDLHLDWQDAFVRRCARMARDGRRGLVNPRARARRSMTDADVQLYWDDTFRDDPNFHPAFASVSPLKLQQMRR